MRKRVGTALTAFIGDKSHRASGSGLGLAIAREIMTRLGARLTVHSELGEGSEFSFTLRQENQA